ncbi:unnamed protein product [Rhizoctonia solani]|uniref:Uncharacterized protein n=1 Tax=Rhizoctonia solani TaxID=456999 RepID=A0A8H3H809_9AGAM|nr:hypothetical protein RHS01_10613 [Rhizoctonia solani]CAE6486866.1 unnamed protein product [Rhizoctonia solani]
MVLTRSQAKAAREAELKSRASVVSHASFQAPAVLPVPDLKQNEPTACWVDASSTRIAVLIGKDYITFSLKKGWQTRKRDINWAETVAFELLALVLIARGQIGTVKVRSDSSTALRAIGGNKIRVQEIMDSTQRLKAVVNGSGLMLKGVKVPTKGNLADPFTRGKKIEGYQKMKDTVIIPDALVPFIVAE